MPARTTILAALLVAGTPVPSAAQSMAAAKGKALYDRYCATCHGSRGDGRGPTALYYASPRPRDLTRGVFRFRSTRSGELPLVADLARTIGRGIPGTVMPAWAGYLAPDDIDAVVHYLETLSPRFAESPEAEREALPVPASPDPTAEAVERGRIIYLAVGCWNCHGVAGRGDGPAAATLRTDDDEPIAATDLTSGVLKGGSSSEDLYRVLVTGLDGTPMPSFLEALVVTRELEASLEALTPHLPAGELERLRAALADYPAGEAYAALGADDQARMTEAWRWDLVHYLRSLSVGSWWRRVLGLAAR